MTDELPDRLKAMPTGELVQILRDHDVDEWRPEVFPLVEAILRERGVDTHAVADLGPSPHQTVELGGLETVASLRTALEANLVRMALEEAGIDAWLSTENLASIAPPLGFATGVDVLVRPDTATAAREVLADVEAGARRLPEEVEVCPQCGGHETEHVRKTDRLSAVAGWVFAATPIPAVAWRWKCRCCSFEWE